MKELIDITYTLTFPNAEDRTFEHVLFLRRRDRLYDARGGPTWTLLPQKHTIHKSYGFFFRKPDDFAQMDRDYDKLDEIYKAHACQYWKIEPSPIIDSSGWIAPNGDFYACGHSEHAGVAAMLAITQFDTLRDGEKTLDDAGFIKVSSNFAIIASRGKQTEKQKETCLELSLVVSNKRLKNSLERIALL